MSNQEKRMRPPAQTIERQLMGSVNFNDVLTLQKRVDQDGEDWVSVCEELGDKNRAYAMEQLELNRKQTAIFFLQSAQALYRIGNYGLVGMTDEKMRIHTKSVECCKLAGTLYDTPWEEVKIPYDGFDMLGYIIKPDHMKPLTPIVIMIPGGTGWKEEMVKHSELIKSRGCAVLLIDGPGQGSTLYYNNGSMKIEIEEAYSTMVDYLEKDGRFGNIGIMGSSTGGYYVARAAATDKRLKACVINGGSYHPEEILDCSPIYTKKFAINFGVSEEEMTDIFPKMNLENLADKIECPLLIMNGDADFIFTPESSKRIYNEAKSEDKTLILYPGAHHCNDEYACECFQLAADWLWEKLH